MQFRKFLLNEIGPMPMGGGFGGAPAMGGMSGGIGGMPGLPPPGGGMGAPAPPPMGGMGGPPMGGMPGMGGQPGQTPTIEIKAKDVWQLLEKLLSNQPNADKKNGGDEQQKKSQPKILRSV